MSPVPVVGTNGSLSVGSGVMQPNVNNVGQPLPIDQGTRHFDGGSSMHLVRFVLFFSFERQTLDLSKQIRCALPSVWTIISGFRKFPTPPRRVITPGLRTAGRITITILCTTITTPTAIAPRSPPPPPGEARGRLPPAAVARAATIIITNSGVGEWKLAMEIIIT